MIQKADKGNNIVILDKISHISAIEKILNDHTKFPNLDISAGQGINFLTNLEKRITSDLELLKDKETIDKTTYKNIKPVGSKPGVLYGLEKVHQEAKNAILPFRPILSAIGTPTYKLAKLLLPFLTPLTQNEYTATDLFHLLKKFVNNTLIYIWLVWMLIPYLLTFHWTKPLIFALIVCITMMRIALRSLLMFFVIWLPWPPKNGFLCLTTNSINKLMVWLWGLH